MFSNWQSLKLAGLTPPYGPHQHQEPPGPFDRAAPDLPALRVAQGVRWENGPLDRFLIRLTPPPGGRVAPTPRFGRGPVLGMVCSVGKLPSPAWGGVGGGGVFAVRNFGRPPPPAFPTRGRGR